MIIWRSWTLAKPTPVPPMPGTFATYFKDKPAGMDKTAEARAILTTSRGGHGGGRCSRGEADRLMGLYTLASRITVNRLRTVLKVALKGVLVSPHFLFRGELQPDPDNPNSVHPIDEYALATRLSYFLWSSTPDDELLALAGRQELRKNLPGQVHRMLTSPKAHALVENFAGQWLQIRNLDSLQPDKDYFREYDEGLRKAMQKETQLFFANILGEDHSILEFLTADYTFVNGRLARFYGMPNINGEEFQKVSLAGTNRSGVLTQAEHFNADFESDADLAGQTWQMGAWRICWGPPHRRRRRMCRCLPDDGQPVSGSLRHQMEKHREKPVCASCHAQMDPIGFGLENFNAIGRWRDKDGEFPIEPAGELKTGETFKNAVELTKILAETKKEDFARCLTDKMMTYALGRGTEYYDRATIEKVVQELDRNDYKFSTLIMGIVNSTPFQMRRGEGEMEPAPTNPQPRPTGSNFLTAKGRICSCNRG